MRIIFFASSKIGLPVFQFLVMNRFVVGLCLPKKDFEQKQQFLQVAQWSQIPVIEVDSKELDHTLRKWVLDIAPSLVMVFTFSFKIPDALLKAVPKGFFNIHFGQLPQYKGPEPLFWQMKNQEKEIVITIHKMTSNFDAGPIAMIKRVPIEKNEKYGGLQLRLSNLSVNLVNDFLLGVTNETVVLKNQITHSARVYAKPSYEDVRINWEVQTASEIASLTRAVNPWNKGAITYLGKEVVKLLLVSVCAESSEDKIGKPGSILAEKKSHSIKVLTLNGGVVEISALYVEEGYMSPIEFLENRSHRYFQTELEIHSH